MSAVRMMPSAFHRVKYNMELVHKGREPARKIRTSDQTNAGIAAASPRSARRLLVILVVPCIRLGRLALGTDARDHLAHLAPADSVGDLELDLIVVDDLGDLADQTALGHDRVAAADVLDE